MGADIGFLVVLHNSLQFTDKETANVYSEVK